MRALITFQKKKKIPAHTLGAGGVNLHIRGGGNIQSGCICIEDHDELGLVTNPSVIEKLQACLCLHSGFFTEAASHPGHYQRQ